MTETPEEIVMEEYCYHSNSCANCGYMFIQSESQSRTQHFSFGCTGFTKSNEELKEIQIVDAIYYIFGLHFSDLCLERNYASESPEVVGLCSECIPLFNKLYDSFKDFKKLSHDDSLLWNSVKWKRSKVSVKNEFPDDLESPFLNLDSTETAPAVNLKREFVNLYNGFDGNEVGFEQRQQFNCEDLFDDNYMADDTLNASEEPFVDPDDYKNVKPEIGNHSVAKSTFPGINRFRKKIKASRLKVKQESSQYLHHEYNSVKKERKTGDKRIRIKKRKRGSKLAVESFQWEVKHLDSLNGAVPIKCCNIRFENDSDFTSHVKENHVEDSEKVETECEICKRKVLSKYLDFHMKVLHQDLSAFDCSTCQKTFSTKSYLRKHKQQTHKTIRERKGTRIFCEECKKYFEYCYFYRYHKPVIHRKDDKKFQCEFCGSSLNSELYLKTHIHLYHSGNNSKCCDKCGKIFRNSYNLSRHKRIHEADLVTDKEQFKCTQCGITLKHSVSLRKHMYLMHGKAALKTFSCEICGKTTRSMTNMRIHMKVHDPNRIIKQKTTIQENVIPNAPIIATIDIPQIENNCEIFITI